MPTKDAPVMDAMKTLSARYPRYGYRRIRVFLQRQGFALSWSRTHRLCDLAPEKRSSWLMMESETGAMR